MAEIIAIANQKGGTGKTTTAVNLSVGLVRQGVKVLVIEIDQQCNLSKTLKADRSKPTSYEILRKDYHIEQTIQTTSYGLDFIPGSPYLVGADDILRDVGYEYRLKEAIQNLERNYDYILIDTPPNLSRLIVNAFTCASKVIVAIQPDHYGLDGFEQLYNNIQSLKKYTNPNLAIEGFAITKYDSRTKLSRRVKSKAQKLAAQLNAVVFNPIRATISFGESQIDEEGIFGWDPDSNAALDYRIFVNELLARREGKN